MPELIKQLMQAGLVARGTLHIMVEAGSVSQGDHTLHLLILQKCTFSFAGTSATLYLPSQKRFIPAEAVGALEAHIVCDVCDHVFAVVKQERRGMWVRSKKLICVMLC